MILRKSSPGEIAFLTEASKAAFASDAALCDPWPGGPPDYDNEVWHRTMCRRGHLYTFLQDDGTPLGGAVLFPQTDALYIGRIFLHPDFFLMGYGLKLIEAIEGLASAGVIRLDTPAWNIRTNSFYRKCGYTGRPGEDGFIYYEKHLKTRT